VYVRDLGLFRKIQYGVVCVCIAECVRVRDSVLQYVAVCCGVFCVFCVCVVGCVDVYVCVTVCCSMLQYVEVCCGVLWCVVVCCGVLWCVLVCFMCT